MGVSDPGITRMEDKERTARRIHPRTRVGCGASYARGCGRLLVVIALCAGHSDVRAEDVADRVAMLRESVEPWMIEEDLIDSLFLDWFDRPYARTTIAILVKTVHVLERERDLRRVGNGAMSDRRINELLRWAEGAVTRVHSSEPDTAFRPHRLRMDARPDSGGLAAPALLGIVDESTATRLHPTFGDLDLIAAIGVKVYGRPARIGEFEAIDATTAARAAYLGMLPAQSTETPSSAAHGPSDDGAGEGMSPSVSGSSVVRIRSYSLREMIEDPESPSRPSIRAVSDPYGGEPVGCAVARRALFRGVFGGSSPATDGFLPPRGVSRDRAGDAMAAMLWAEAADGQTLALLRGWRDLRDGSASRYESVLVDPALIERLAIANLDVLRFREALERLPGEATLSIVVGREAVDPGDPNRWADWAASFWESMLDQQVSWRVLPERAAAAHTLEPGRSLRLTPAAVADGSLLMNVGRTQEALEVGDAGFTVRDQSGNLLPRVFVRNGSDDRGVLSVIVINLSNEARSGYLHGPTSDPLRDVLSNRALKKPGEALALGPWQVFLFTSNGE